MLHNVLTLTDLLEEHRRSRPDSLAIAFEGMTFNWPQVADRVRRLAGALLNSGIQEGDRVLWLGQNTHAVLECIISCSQIGAIFCPVNWRQSAPEIAFVIDDLEPSLVIFQDMEIGLLARSALSIADHKNYLTLNFDANSNDSSSYERFISSAPDAPHAENNDPGKPCLIIYTAAFSGKPAGAILSQTAILWQNMVLLDVQGLSSKTVFLNSGPLFHVGTLMNTMATFHIGGANVFIRRSGLEVIAEAIHAYRCTRAFLMEKTMTELAVLNRAGRYDLSSLQSHDVDPEWNSMVTLVSERSLFGYGQTEVMGPVTWAYYGHGDSISRNGRTGPAAQVRILDDSGMELPPLAIGEIAVRGPTVMLGYWRRPELNAQRIVDGWHRCNDLGRRETDGSLTFVGPKSRMIKSGAENIYPAEVEACIRSHPDVLDCAIIGIPDETWVQSVKALVIRAPSSSISEYEIIIFCKEKIASYKKPKSVFFVESLPKNSSGLTDYEALDRNFGGGNYPGGNTKSH